MEDQPQVTHDTVMLSVEGGLAVIRLQNAPNALLTSKMRDELSVHFDYITKNQNIEAVILCADGTDFCKGSAPLKRSDADVGVPLQTLCTQIENCEAPVVAALSGDVSEAGFALAVSAHYRICTPQTRFRAPDIMMGLIPDGGLTQRLPRLIGPRFGLELLLSGKYVRSADSLKIGLVDQIVDGELIAQAQHVANQLADGTLTPRRSSHIETHLQDPKQFGAVIAQARESTKSSRIDAARSIVDVLEAALVMPFDAGLGREAIARNDARQTTQHMALSYSFDAVERLTVPSPQGGVPQRVGILAGPPQAVVALGLATAKKGIGLSIVPTEGLAPRPYRRGIWDELAAEIDAGQLTNEQRDEIFARCRFERDWAAFADCDFVLDMSDYDTQERAGLLQNLEADLPETVPLISNVHHGFDVLVRGLARPQNFMGFSRASAPVGTDLTELAPMSRTSHEVKAAVHAYFKAIGHVPVMVEAHDGLCARALVAAAGSAIDTLLFMGASPSQIDKAMQARGFFYQFCVQMDALGLENCPGLVPEYLVSHGRTGQGSGLYEYEGDSRSDAKTVQLLDALRAREDLPKTEFTDAEIADFIILAQANCGARLLQIGAVSRPVDLDVLMLSSQVYPPWIGGPMRAADIMTPLQAQKKLTHLAQFDPEIWQPVALWQELIKNGARFEDLDIY